MVIREKKKKEKQPPGIDRRPYPQHTHTQHTHNFGHCQYMSKSRIGWRGFLSCLNIDFFPAEVTRSLSSLSTRLDLTECVRLEIWFFPFFFSHLTFAQMVRKRWESASSTSEGCHSSPCRCHPEKSSGKQHTHSFLFISFYWEEEEEAFKLLLQWRNFLFFPCVMRPFKIK